MKIIQFHCSDETIASLLIELITNQANIWSRLKRLSSDPDYVTAPFSTSVWQKHTTDDLYWGDYDSLYANLGDDGKAIADQLLEPGDYTGVLLGKTLLPTYPEASLEMVNVDDLVAAGYIAASGS